MTFWGVTIYSDTLHWSDISLTRGHLPKQDFITNFDRITKFREVSMERLQRVRLAIRGHLVLPYENAIYVTYRAIIGDI